MVAVHKKPIYAFIDSQNLNLGIRSQGWKLDFSKFFVYLKDKLKVTKTFLFIGFLKENQKLYRSLTKSGYTLVYKPIAHGEFGKIKGNVDAELVLQVRSQGNKNGSVVCGTRPQTFLPGDSQNIA